MLQRGAILSGKYRVDSVLGEGGMAVVYAVTHLRTGARRAVKVLHADSMLKGHVRARFEREGKVAHSVKHPGAVEIFDDGVGEDGSPYLVMEHLDGLCADDIGARAMPLTAALSIAYQVLDVLRAAHANGIIHRDIKPANLFLLRDGRVKVLDFGISRLHDGGEPFDSATTGAVMGTPFFMAPEQARAVTREIDARTDLFGVGATLFTLISGKYLYTGDQSRQVMIQAATEQARSLGSVAPGTPQAVIDLVSKAVAYDSAARWQSAEAMQDAVRELHEALYGPIAFETLSTLVLVHEFRRKSHAKFSGPVRRCRRATSNGSTPSALSTTLPAVADVTRSRESFREAYAPRSNDQAPSSRISSGPPELAGWTGHVPVRAKQKAESATHTGSRFGRAVDRARVLRAGVLLAAVLTAFFGFSRYQSERHAAAVRSRAAPAVLPPPLLQPPPSVAPEAMAIAIVPTQVPQPNARAIANTRSSSKPASAATATKPTSSAGTMSAKPWENERPILVRSDNYLR
jgi:eukaryotic-like serine/threonine-protein kinase